MKEVVLGGGCFWGVQEYYRRLKGVVKTEVGYSQGKVLNPTYQEVCQGRSGHVEVVKIIYEESEITLQQLLDHFFRFVDPLTLNKQGNDVGTQYRSGIYYVDLKDKEIIIKVLEELQKSYSSKIVVETEPLHNYFKAEPEHQDYLLKNPQGYCHVDFSLIKSTELK